VTGRQKAADSTAKSGRTLFLVLMVTVRSEPLADDRFTMVDPLA